MELVPGFTDLLQGLSATMTAPTFATLTTVLTGWVFAGRRTVTRMILAAGSAADKHYSSYHRLFSAARWSLDALGLSVFVTVHGFRGTLRTFLNVVSRSHCVRFWGSPSGLSSVLPPPRKAFPKR
jgi:succinate dehydrogenase/fumarate reductase cytochrome b subunit